MKNLESIATDLAYLRESHDGFRQETKAELREIKSDGKETKAQATITNGRVTKAEADIRAIQDRETSRANRRDKYSDRYIAPTAVGVAMILAQVILKLILK